MPRGKYIRTLEIREKNCIGMLNNKNALGAKRTIEQRNKYRLTHLGKIGLAGEKNPMFGRCREKHPRWKGGLKNYLSKIANAVYREFNINILCDKCGATEDICIHHKDRNRRNNNIDNLQPLCRSCHMHLHTKGKIFSEEHRKKISEAKMGVKKNVCFT